MNAIPAVLIFSGNNQRAVIAFCRFAAACDIDFFIVARNESDSIFLTDYRKNIIGVREHNEFNVSEFNEYAGKLKRKLVVLPSTEYLNRFLIESREALESIGYIIPLCNKNLYERISDKQNFGALCTQYGIPVPGELESVSEFTAPFVAKPRKYISDSGAIYKPEIILTKSDFVSFNQHYNSIDFYYQEFIYGESFYLLYHFSKDNSWSVYSQENLMQQHNGRSVILARSADFHQREIASRMAHMFNGIGFKGLVMVEVKYFNEKYYVIEANPRLWGPSQLILDAGMDLFHKFALDCGLINAGFSGNYHSGKYYFWHGGLTEDLKADLAVAYHNYSGELFLSDESQLMENEIYLRNDTVRIYQLENQ